MQEKGNIQCIRIMTLMPNNCYINQARLDRIGQAWRFNEQERLLPVLVSKIDGILGVIDGHARTYAAYERGETCIAEAYTGRDMDHDVV